MNAQLRLLALHHLDVPWLPSDIEQREGRIERQTGLIARIEHVLEHLPAQKANYQRKAQETGQRLLGFQERLGQSFALQGELDGKLAQLATLEADLKREDQGAQMAA